MPRNGAGTYTLPAGNPVIPNTTISSSVQNTTMSDVASAITQSIAKDGQTVATANLPMGGFKHTNVASAAQANEYATLGQLQTSVAAYLVGVSGGDTITANGSPPVTAYQTGSNYRFKAAATNATTNVTINIDSVGAIPLFRNDGKPVGIGGITIGEVVEFTYDGTNGIITSTSNSLADGGTGGSSRASGLQNLLPSQAGNSGNVLTSETVQYTSVSRARAANIATLVITPTARMPSVGDQLLIAGLPASYIGSSVVIAVGANSISYYSQGSDESTTADVSGTITNYIAYLSPPITRGSIDGFNLSTAGSSTTMAISAGVASDSTNTTAISLQSSLSKTTSAWAVGSGNGGLDTGTIANSTWYYFFAIRRPDTGVVDVIFSLSSSSPALPTNYTQYRYIGAGLNNASAQWQQFTQSGDEFYWNTPVIDFNTIGSTTPALLTCSVPRGRKVKAFFNIGNNANTSSFISITDPDNAAYAGTYSGGMIVGGGTGWYSQAQTWTNTSAQIRHQESAAAATVIATLGWLDSRGKE